MKSRFVRTETETHFSVLTVVNLGKEIVSRAVTSVSSNWSMDSMLSPERVVTAELLFADNVPAIFLMPFSAIVPAAFVAIAMLPEKVEHEALADASALLWMVVVAEILQAAVGHKSQHDILNDPGGDRQNGHKSEHTVRSAGGGQDWQRESHKRRHCEGRRSKSTTATMGLVTRRWKQLGAVCCVTDLGY